MLETKSIVESLNDRSSDTTVPDNSKPEKIIDVEADYDGDLEEAIDAAKDGDTVQLGSNTYETSGLSIENDITIVGQEGSIVDGGGTTDPIFDLAEGASGATIEDLEITDGNIGINAVGAKDVTLQGLKIHDIGIDETIRYGQNNVAVNFFYADGFELLDSEIYNVGRKGVGVNDTDGGTVQGLTIEDINLDAEHAQSFDAGGIKLFNTNDVIISENELSGINAFHIWNDITNSTVIEGNTILGVGEDFIRPEFNQNVIVSGIYNEKSYESVVRDNKVTTVDDYVAFDATAFTTETLELGENDFSKVELNTTDYWANEEAEKMVAITEDPAEANFSLFEEDFFKDAVIGDDIS